MKIKKTGRFSGGRISVLCLVLALCTLFACTPGGTEGETAPESGAATESEVTIPMTDTPETAAETELRTSPEAETAVDTIPVTETPTEAVTEPLISPEELVNPEIKDRYFIYRIWNFNKLELNAFKAIVNAAQAAGFNAIKIHMPWFHIEKTPGGEYDFSGFDDMVKYCIMEKEMKVAISLDLTRRLNDGYFPDSVFMVDYAGNLSVADGRMQISFAADEAIDAAVRFYADAVAHFDRMYGDEILFYLPAFNQYCETEYWAGSKYDYSEIAVNAFHDFLRDKYRTVDALNAVLGSDYADFGEVVPPDTSAKDELGTLWYQFRHNLLKKAIDKLADAQKASSPDTKLAVQFGSVYDHASKNRGTLCFGELCEKVDVLWIDDAPTYYHAFAMDYVRGLLPPTVELAQEIDSPNQTGATIETYRSQGMDSFRGGATYLSIANWSINEQFEQYKPLWREIADTWLVKNPPEIALRTADSPVIEVSLRSVFKSGNTDRWQTSYQKLADGQHVYIRITDDLSGYELPVKKK